MLTKMLTKVSGKFLFNEQVTMTINSAMKLLPCLSNILYTTLHTSDQIDNKFRFKSKNTRFMKYKPATGTTSVKD